MSSLVACLHLNSVKLLGIFPRLDLILCTLGWSSKVFIFFVQFLISFMIGLTTIVSLGFLPDTVSTMFTKYLFITSATFLSSRNIWSFSLSRSAWLWCVPLSVGNGFAVSQNFLFAVPPLLYNSVKCSRMFFFLIDTHLFRCFYKRSNQHQIWFFKFV